VVFVVLFAGIVRAQAEGAHLAAWDRQRRFLIGVSLGFATLVFVLLSAINPRRS
jgi:hypothetical protein